MDPDQPAHPRSLIRIHAVRYQFLYLLNSMDPDQTARMRRLIWIHAGRKHNVGFVMARLKYSYKLKQ
jgi:hypothetical protein